MGSVIELKPLARVEGHGRVNVFFAGKRAEKVQFSLYESPRLFEALLLGKQYVEVAEIICRICSLCSTVHRVTSLQAIENAMGLKVSEQTRLYRELIVNGGHIQSHALHLFCLVLPDIHGVGGVADLARKAPDALTTGLNIKAVGNAIQETIGGRLIHPVTLIPGGMGKPVSRNGLLRLRNSLEEILPDAVAAVGLFSAVPKPTDALPAPHYLAVDPVGRSPLFGNCLRTSGGVSAPARDYRNVIREQFRSGSNAKWSVAEDKMTTGALARLNLEMPLTAGASTALEQQRRRIEGADIRANNLAQAIELVHGVERSIELIDLILAGNFAREPRPSVAAVAGSGTAVMEAPRGVLVHSYTFDSGGHCTAADIVTPTAVNQAAIERDLLTLARTLEGEKEHELKHQLEMLVRAYDPCISCAVHFVGI